MKMLRYAQVSLLSLVITASACKKDYLNTNPTSQVSQTAAFDNTTGAAAALNGIHRLLYSALRTQGEGGQGSIMITMDFMGDDIIMHSRGSGWFMSDMAWTTHRNVTTSDYPYYFYYKIIANANQIIANIDKAAGPDADKKRIKAEALTFRAWGHFVLVQLYGKRYDKATAPNAQLGVPLVLTTDVTGQPRSTVEQVYAQVNKDLDDAITNFTGTAARANASHFNVNVAKGLKARVALAMQNWDSAASLAKEAVQGFNLMANADYKKGFNDYTNAEWMWGSHQVEDQSTDFNSFFAYMANFNSSHNRLAPKCINKTLYNTISATDVRKGIWDPTGADLSFKVPPGGTRFKYMQNKFLIPGQTSVGDVPYMRAAEMYLMQAEAYARGGQFSLAQDALYTLAHQRDPSYVKSTSTGDVLIAEIMNQRRVELWGEGFRFLDLKRLNLPLDRIITDADPTFAITMSVPAGDNMWQWLIPQTELNANPAVRAQPQNL